MTGLTIVRQIAARPEIVFEAISTAEGIAQWWGPDAGPVLISEVDLKVGGRFRVRFRMLDGAEYEVSGEFIEIVPPKRLALTWNWLDGEAKDESRLDFELRPIENGTEVVFTHTLLPSESTARGHEKGWNGSFDKLARHLRSPRVPDRA